MTQKAQLQSAGDGTAVPTGYVGEYKEALGNYTAVGNNVFTATGNSGVALTSGVWDIQGFYTINAASGTSVTKYLGVLSTSSLNDEIGVDYTRAAATNQFSSKIGNGSDSDRVSTPIYRVVVPSGSTITYWPKIRVEHNGTVNATASIFARRIA
jgi:hypothetical protein